MRIWMCACVCACVLMLVWGRSTSRRSGPARHATPAGKLTIHRVHVDVNCTTVKQSYTREDLTT